MKTDTKIVCSIAAGMGEASPTYLCVHIDPELW